MKTTLLSLTLFFIGIFSIQSQTQTHDLDWFAGIGAGVNLTIEENDTVKWTWTSPNHSVENDPGGSSVETFNSGILASNGSTFSHTFTVIGSNDYYCVVHGAGSMSGTITVVAEGTLDIEDFSISNFSIFPNPSNNKIVIKFPKSIVDIDVKVFDVLGKKIYNGNSDSNMTIDVSAWTKGMYFVKTSSEGKTKTKKFIKE